MGKQEVIGIGEFLTPLDPKLRISSGSGAIRVPDNYLRRQGWRSVPLN